MSNGIEILFDKVFSNVEKITNYNFPGHIGNDEIVFTEEKSGRKYHLFHENECCEIVTIEDIVGDLSDLVGSPILMAEEVSNHDSRSEESIIKEDHGSWTWTFYKLATVKGYVTIRWYGESNGNYSEEVSFEEIKIPF